MPLNVTFIEDPKKFNFFNFGVYLGPGETQEERKEQNVRALILLQHYGVLPSRDTVMNCKECRTQLRISNDKTKNFLGFRVWCKNRNCMMYEKKKSPLNGTLCSHSNMPLTDNGKDYYGLADFLKLLVLWFFRVSVTNALYHGQIGSSATVVQYYRFFRETCRVVESHDTEKIGSADDVVEVDESHIYKRKNNKGRALYSEKNLWVFGGVSRKTGKKFAVRVDKRNNETLHSEMSAHIEQGSFIFSDGWPCYPSSVDTCGFKGHASVNHSAGEFVRPYPELIENIHRSLGTRVLADPPSQSPNDPSIREVQVHTNTVERMWRDMKEHMRGVRGDNQLIEDVIGEWLYRRNVLDYENDEHGQQFVRFLRDIGRVYPGINKIGIKDPYAEACLCPSCLNLNETEEA